MFSVKVMKAKVKFKMVLANEERKKKGFEDDMK